MEKITMQSDHLLGTDIVLMLGNFPMRTWRTDYGWREEGSNAIQGEWGGWGNHRSLFYMGKNSSTLNNNKSIVVKLDRLDSGGNYGKVPIYVYVHEHEHFNENPELLPIEPVSISLSRGQGGWVTLSEEMLESFNNGVAKGVAIAVPDDKVTRDTYAVIDPKITMKIQS